MNETLWSVSIRDFFTKRMLQFALIPFIGTVLVMYVLFFGAASAGLDALEQSTLQVEQHQQTQQNGVVETQSETTTVEGGSAILRFLMEHTVTSWLVSFIVFTVGGIATFILAMFVALAIIGFLTPYIVREIHARHYSHLPLEHHGSIAGILLASLKHVVIMLLLFLVLTPFYFVPMLNLVAFNLPFYYLFHKLYLLDVASETTTKERFKLIMAFHGGKVRMTTLGLYLLSLVPFAAYITPVFNVIVLTHSMFRKSVEVEAHHESATAAKSAADKVSNGSQDVLPS
ncbi:MULTISPECIES: EI24 domain-containing protein [Sulfurimonas]|uniref:EI24 domain-containing protein n=1 Tax=Sulfurimonas diazotrophicus TaxID=3131939 RepID=A0ABZ3HBJ7_9BACT